MTAPTRPRRRVRPWAFVGVVLIVVAAWASWAYAVVQNPRTDTPAPVDAVLVLGGHAPEARTEQALQLVRDGLTRNLVISTPPGRTDDLTRRTCDEPPAGVDVVCFRPDPTTTRGESRELGRLAAEHGWTRVAVITSEYHVSRSRMIVGRCFGGTILMLPMDERISAGSWAYQWIYQTAGYAKALVLQGC